MTRNKQSGLGISKTISAVIPRQFPQHPNGSTRSGGLEAIVPPDKKLLVYLRKHRYDREMQNLALVSNQVVYAKKDKSMAKREQRNASLEQDRVEVVHNTEAGTHTNTHIHMTGQHPRREIVSISKECPNIIVSSQWNPQTLLS